MRYEYNDILITNDVGVTNDPGLKSSIAETAELAVETASVTELESVKEISEDSGRQALAKKSAQGISRIISMSGAVTVVAAVAVVAVAEITAQPAPVMPTAIVSEVDVTSFSYGRYLSVQFTVTDDGEEIENYLIWIEDADGDVCECTVDIDGDVWTAAAELTEDTDWETGLELVVHVESYDGWSGELFREAIALPAAPDIGVEYTTVYNADSGEVTINYELYDEYSLLGSYTARLLDESGSETDYSIDYTEQTITTTITDGAGELYLVIDVTSADGWTGEIFNETVALPEAPNITVYDPWIDTAYSTSDGSEMVYVGGMEYEGDTENIAYYTYWFEDEDGQKYEFTVSEDTSGSLRAEVALPVETPPAFDAFGRLYLVIEATTLDGWMGEIYREKHKINIDAELTVPYIMEFAINAAEDGIMYIYVDLIIYDPDAVLSDITLTITDESGQVFTSPVLSEDELPETDGETYYYYLSITAETFTADENSDVYVTLTATYTVPDGNGGYTTYEDTLCSGMMYVYFY